METDNKHKINEIKKDNMVREDFCYPSKITSHITVGDALDTDVHVDISVDDGDEDKMKEYKIKAEARATATIHVWALNGEEALDRAKKEMKGMYEEEWGLSDRTLLKHTLEKVVWDD